MFVKGDIVAEKAKEIGNTIEDDGAAGSNRPVKVVHVRLDGKTKELILSDISLTSKSTDEEIFAVLAKSLRVDIERFSLFSVERLKDGNIFLHPDAIFSEK